jgi:hypothetical protein
LCIIGDVLFKIIDSCRSSKVFENNKNCDKRNMY